MTYSQSLDIGNNNVKKANDLLIELVFEPLNKSLQDNDIFLGEFSYYNHRTHLLVIGVSEKYVLKMSVIDNTAASTSFDAIKIEIVHKSSLLKIDEQILYFDSEFSAIKKNRMALQTFNTEQDMTSTVYQINNYLSTWITVLQEQESKTSSNNDHSSEQLKLGFELD